MLHIKQYSMGFGSFPTFSIDVDEKVGKKSRPVGCPLNPDYVIGFVVRTETARKSGCLETEA